MTKTNKIWIKKECLMKWKKEPFGEWCRRHAVSQLVGVTCSVVGDPGVDDADCLLWLAEVHLIRVGLEGLGQGPAESLLQAHLPLHHDRAGRLHPLLTGHIPLQETLLPGHPSLCRRGERRRMLFHG